jgi:type VI secretion system protein ImpH
MLTPDDLGAEAPAVEFFQAVRMLLRAGAARHVSKPSEVVRFVPSGSLAYPTGMIESVDPGCEGRPAQMKVPGLGLTGTQGALPLWYSEFLSQRLAKQDEALLDFLALVQQPFMWLYYRAWEKRHAFVQFESQPDRDPFTECLLALIGMQPGSLGGDASRQRKLLRYAGLLTQRPLSAPALAFILSDYFGEKIAIEQVQGRWRALEDDGRPRLFGEGSSDKLGYGTLVGDEGWDQQAAFRIAIGPLSRERLFDWMPGAAAFEELCQIVQFVLNEPLEFEINLVLRAAEVPFLRLQDGCEAPCLGIFSWLKVDEFQSDARETIFAANDGPQGGNIYG